MSKKPSVTEAGPTITAEEAREIEVSRAETALRASGLVLFVDANPDSVPVRGRVAIRLGAEGAILASGQMPHLIPMVIRFAGDEASQNSINSAAARSNTSALLSRLDDGWKETDSNGQVQYIVALPTADPTGLLTAISLASLAARTAVGRNGRKIGEIRVDKAALAPSRLATGNEWTRVSGKMIPTRITASELAGIGCLLDEASMVRDPESSSVWDVRHHPTNINSVRDYFNRQPSSAARASEVMKEAGWQLSPSPDAMVTHTIAWAPGSPTAGAGFFGGDELPTGTLFTFDDRDDQSVAESDLGGLQKGTVYRPFDILVAIKYSGNVELAVEKLLESGEARLEREAFAAFTRPNVELNQDTNEVIAVIVDSIARGSMKADTSIPLALAHIADGTDTLRGVVSVTAAGGTRVWNENNISGLIGAAVQMVSFAPKIELGATEKEVRNFHHGLPADIRTAVWERISTRGTLREVKFVANEPMITTTGAVVTEHGYNPSEKVLLAVPERSRQKWGALNVPKSPTQTEAQASFDWIRKEVVGDFPFDDASGEANWFAYLLTAAARGICNQSPLFLSAGAEWGAGKSKVLGIVRLIVQGYLSCDRWDGGNTEKSEAEDVKKLVSALLSSTGRVFMHNDEVAMGVGGIVESRWVTAGVTQLDGENKGERLLQGNEQMVVSDVIITGAGKGAIPHNDLKRRTLMWEIVVKDGVSATDRTGFRHADLEGWIAENRVEILGHVFTILSHGLKNPADVPSMGFNGNWARIVLASLSYVTIDGAAVSDLIIGRQRRQQGKADEMTEDWSSLLAGLSRLSSGGQFKGEHARLWAEQHSLEIPAKIRNGGGVNAVQKNRNWAMQLTQMKNSKLDSGDFRYILSLAEQKAGAPKMFSIARFDLNGKPAPEQTPSLGLPVEIDYSGTLDDDFSMTRAN